MTDSQTPSHWWPALKTELTNDPTALFRLECPLCFRNMKPPPTENNQTNPQFPGLRDNSIPLDYPSRDDPAEVVRGICILPCGHATCASCFSDFTSAHNHNYNGVCPLCKEAVRHPKCGQTAMIYPLRTVDDVQSCPLVKHEGGAGIGPVSMGYRLQPFCHSLAKQLFSVLIMKGYDLTRFQDSITFSIRFSTGTRIFNTYLRKDGEPSVFPVHDTIPPPNLQNVIFFETGIANSMNALIREKMPTPSTPTWEFLPVELAMGLDQTAAPPQVRAQIQRDLRHERVDPGFDPIQWWAIASADQTNHLRRVLGTVVEPAMELLEEHDDDRMDDAEIVENLREIMREYRRGERDE